MEIGYYPHFNKIEFGEDQPFNSLLVGENLWKDFSRNGQVNYRFNEECNFIIRAEAPDDEDWEMSTDGHFWNICWNTWFVSMANLPPSEIAILRYFACVSTFDITVSPKPGSLFGLQASCEPQKPSWLSESPMSLICPWFQPLTGKWGPLEFVFTDLILVNLKDQNLNSDHTVSTSLAVIRNDRRFYDTYSLDKVVLYPNRAILLCSTSRRKLYAIPWKSTDLKKKSHIDKYFQKVYRWFDNRCTDPNYNKKCPAKVLFAEDPTERILVDSKSLQDDYSIFALSSEMLWVRIPDVWICEPSLVNKAS